MEEGPKGGTPSIIFSGLRKTVAGPLTRCTLGRLLECEYYSTLAIRVKEEKGIAMQRSVADRTHVQQLFLICISSYPWNDVTIVVNCTVRSNRYFPVRTGLLSKNLIQFFEKYFFPPKKTTNLRCVPSVQLTSQSTNETKTRRTAAH